MGLLGVILEYVISILVTCGFLLKWNGMRHSKKGLPPGTMGWPLFGETTDFLKQGPSFMKKQRARYGAVFKSHVLGCPTIVCMAPEVNRYILMNEGKGPVPGYPQSMLDLLGKCNIAALNGSLHKSVRSCMLSLVSPVMLANQLLPKIDCFMRSHLNNWTVYKVIDIQEKTKEMALLSSLKQVAIIENGQFAEALKEEIHQLVLGTLSLPINLPGTSYRRAFQARKKIISMLTELINKRSSSTSLSNDDMLDYLLKKDEEAKIKLDNEKIIDLIIALGYSGYETVSTTSMMAVKYLHDHPKAMEKLRNEHLDIRKGKLPDDGLSWSDYKSMKFTRAVIFETLRLATVVNGVLRKTTQDIELKGYVIPKGWKIYVYTREINYDPILYPEPLTFNPWGWINKSLETNQYILLFGGGSRLCPGKELGLVEISTFLHYFVTRYSWEEVGDGVILKFPRVEAPNGLHICISDL